MNPPYSIGAVSKVKLAILAEAQNWRCAYCGERCMGEDRDWDAPSRDHIVPVVMNGAKDWWNEVMACNLCNNGRGAMWARQYFRRVQRMGRWKAFKWARKKRKEQTGKKYGGFSTVGVKSVHA